jgi:molybdopterin/thiamine biosynthesis adenylyltransferase
MSQGDDIQNTLHSIKGGSSSTPQILDLSLKTDEKQLKELVERGLILHKVDAYKSQLEELFAIQNPALALSKEFNSAFEKHYSEKCSEKPEIEQGRWVYFPWISTIVHILEKEDFQSVRTARNRYLISDEEQKKFYEATIGIGGLSVGNSVALAIVLQGGAQKIRLADFDRLSLSNLNRIRAGVDALDLKKTELTARQIYLLNPYATIELFSDGLTEENLGTFMDGLDVVIDELDTISLKMRIREEAKKRHLPVIMGADNGDSAIIDIERYDLNPNLEHFHGRLGDVSADQLIRLTKIEIGKKIVMQLEAQNISERMQNSFMQMGKSITSWPQLGGAALINGSAVAYCVRKICAGAKLEKNRAILSLDEKLDPDFMRPEEIERRSTVGQAFARKIGL